MLRHLSLAILILAATSCTADDPRPLPDAITRSVVPIYYFDGSGLSQEYRELREGPDAVRTVMDLLFAGPRLPRHSTAIPPAARVADTGEGEQGLLIEFNDAFWRGPPDALRRRVAQVVYTAAVLEEGKRVTMLRGLVPGRIPGMRQPLERTDFRTARPWLEVRQPVAGALVADEMPVDVDARLGYPLMVSFVHDGEVRARERLESPQSIQVPDIAGEGSIKIEDAAGHAVDIPITFR